MGKYSNVGPLQKLPHGCEKWVDTKVTSQMSKMSGWVKAPFGKYPKERRFFMASLTHPFPQNL